MVLLAAVDSGVYQTLLALHILSVIVAFAPVIVHPLVARFLADEDEGAGRRLSGVAAATQRTVHLPALLLVGILGFALVGSSDEHWKFSDPWVSVSALLWLVIGGVIGAVLIPAQKKVAGGDGGAASTASAASGLVTLLLVVVVFLMVVKPG